MKTNLLFRVTMLVCISVIFSTKLLAQSDNVGLCGPAAINGWIQNGPVMMIQDNANLTKYTFNGYLNVGQLKFSTNAGWSPCWGPVTDGTAMPSSGYTGAIAPTDTKFNIQTAGNYSITIDLTALTVNIQPMTETIPILVNRLFLVGDAGPGGWTLANAPELTKTAGNPWEYTYSGTLSSTGSFKFGTSKGDWSQKMYVKTSDILMNLGGADVKWSVPTTGFYKIVINTNTLAISITASTPTLNPEAKEEVLLKSNSVHNEIEVSNLAMFQYNIFNLTGANLLKGTTSNGSINVSSLTNGIYLLAINNKTVKFIKN